MRLSCSIQAKLPVKFCLALDTEKVSFVGTYARGNTLTLKVRLSKQKRSKWTYFHEDRGYRFSNRKNNFSHQFCNCKLNRWFETQITPPKNSRKDVTHSIWSKISWALDGLSKATTHLTLPKKFLKKREKGSNVLKGAEFQLFPVKIPDFQWLRYQSFLYYPLPNQ